MELARRLAERFPGLVSGPSEFRGEFAVTVGDAQRIAEVMKVAKEELGFDLLLDASGVDHLGREPRFEMVYELYAMSAGAYLRVKTPVAGDPPELPSVCGVWRAADWHEREAFDLMGIKFSGHPDLRRIIMWEGYPHHPLRKDFPLAGLPTEDGRADTAPLAGGPFVTSPGEKTTVEREPRAKG
jgi:NADH-quinone oxidoreductase subunit C